MPKNCPICGGNLVNKIVEVEVSNGTYKRVVRVPADVCQKCGERVYPRESEAKIMIAEEQLCDTIESD